MRRFFWVGSITIVIGVAIGFLITPVISRDNIYSQLDKYQEVYNNAVKNYVDEVDMNELTEAAIKGMLDELDPHSVYITAEDMKAVKEDFSGSFEGIGIQFDIINDTITVISPIAGGPSEALGIQAGDKIINIDGEDAVGIARDEVPDKLKGPKGTKVVVDIMRGFDPELIEFDIIRDKIPIYSVDASFMVEDTDIGVVVVNRFSATTHREMLEAMRKLEAKGMKKLILDLRGNPGGYLTQAFYMANEFLPSGDTIVYTKGRRPEFDEVFRSSGGGRYEDIPIIAMINHGSASASEIVSGAIQDLDRGLVVGTTSFGKGLVQRQYELDDGSAYRLTISRYYTPSGRSIQRPYDDKDSYRRLKGRLDLEEGANIEHALESVKAKMKEEGESDEAMAELDSLPVHYTRSGRPVLGGGGITPDYIVKSDTLTKLGVQLRRNRIFYEFVNNNLNSGTEIEKQFGGDFERFYKEFEVDDDMIDGLKDLAEEKEIEWDKNQFETDEDFIKSEIRATIARIVWDREKYVKIFYDIDRQFQKAITLFPEAVKIAEVNK